MRILALAPLAGALLCITLPAQQRVQTDIVFIIDATSSMGNEITAVQNGLSSFVTGLNQNQVDARFAIVLYGGEAEVVLDFTGDPQVVATAFGQIRVSGAVTGFQNNHNVNPEAGLEAIRIVLGASPEKLNNANCGCPDTLAFRNDALKNLILVTDEDSDRPFWASNRRPGQTGNEPPATLTADWQAEIDETAQAVLRAGAFVNMLINPSDRPSTFQYGNPDDDVSGPNLLGYDRPATLANLVASGHGQSLQAQLLAGNLIARSFGITSVNDPTWVNNFFAAKVEEILCPCANDATSVQYGTGWAGTSGAAIQLDSDAAPSVCTQIQLQVDNTLGADTAGCMLFSGRQAQLPTAFGGDFLVDPAAPIAFPIAYSLPAAGTSVAVPMPCNNLSFCGIAFYVQAFQLDGGASVGVSFSNGLALTIGN